MSEKGVIGSARQNYASWDVRANVISGAHRKTQNLCRSQPPHSCGESPLDPNLCKVFSINYL